MRRALVALVAGTLLSGIAAWAAIAATPAKVALIQHESVGVARAPVAPAAVR